GVLTEIPRNEVAVDDGGRECEGFERGRDLVERGGEAVGGGLESREALTQVSDKRGIGGGTGAAMAERSEEVSMGGSEFTGGGGAFDDGLDQHVAAVNIA